MDFIRKFLDRFYEKPKLDPAKEISSKEVFSDDHLIEQIQSGGKDRSAAIEYMQEAYIGFLKENLYSEKFRGLGKEVLADAYTDALLALDNILYYGKKKSNAKISTVFYSIFHNKCVDALRKKNKGEHRKDVDFEPMQALMSAELRNDNYTQKIEVPVDPSTLPYLSTFVEETNFENEDLVSQLMNQLEPKVRAVLVANIEGYSNKEIVNMFPEYQLRNPNNVGSIIYNGRKKLRLILERIQRNQEV